MTLRLWPIRETTKARCYSRTPPDPKREPDEVWIPISVIDGVTRQVNGEHHVRVQDWFVEKEGL